MRLQGNDILISQIELSDYISYSYIRKKVSESIQLKRPTWKKETIQGIGVCISYNSIPDQSKAKLPSRDELIKLAQAEKDEADTISTSILETGLQEIHQAKFTQHTDYLYYCQQEGINTYKATQLKAAAGWMRLLLKYKSAKLTREIGFNSKTELRQSVANILGEVQLYGLKTSSPEYLRQVEVKWKKALLESEQSALNLLISGKIKNTNRQIVGKVAAESSLTIADGRVDVLEFNLKHLINLAANFGSSNKLDGCEIYEDYKAICAKNDREPVSLSTVRNHLRKPEVQELIRWERDGYAAHDKHLPHVKRKDIQYSLSKGGMDGFSVDFYTNITLDGGRKARVMLQVMLLTDLATGAITGYDIGLVEDGLMVRNAIRQHMNRWDGQAYLEIESDKGSAFMAKDSQAIISALSTFKNTGSPKDITGKSSANPKHRKTERFIQEINRKTQRIEGWKGTNITSIDKNRKPNPDYVQHQQSMEEGQAMIIKLIAAINNEKVAKFGNRTRIEQFKASLNPNARVFTPDMLALVLNKWTKKQLQGDILEITVNRKNYMYSFPDYDLHLHHLGKKREVKISYDETDMSSVHIFGMANEEPYLGEIKLVKLAQGAKAEQTPADLKTIGEREELRKAKQTDSRRKMLEVVASANGIQLPVNGTLEEMEATVQGYFATKENTPVRSFEERFEEELNTEDAVAEIAYYEDRLLRSKGLKVPETKQTSTEEDRIAAARRRYA